MKAYIEIYGTPQIVGASKTSVSVREYDVSGNIYRVEGSTLPTDGDAGYSVGSIFVKTNGGVGTVFYVNEGTAVSCDFNVSAGSTGDITSVVAGAGLTGGGVTGDVTLNVVNTDGKITVGANSIDITAASLVNADINAGAAIAYSKLAALTSANILVGSAGNVATAVAVSGVIAMSNAGATSFAAGAVVNADVNAAAAIAESKLAFNTATGHSHNGVDSKLVSVGTATSIAQACVIEAGANDVNLATTTQTVGATTLTIPDFASVADTFVFATLAQTLANKSLTDATTYFKDNADATKVMQFQLSGITTGTTRTLTVPDVTGTLTVLGNTSTGTGSVVLATTPTLVTPVLGIATATSINKVAFTAPATAATLTIAEGKTLTASASITLAGTDGKTLTVSNSLTLAGADAKTINFGSNSITIATAGDASVTLPVSGTLATLAGAETLAGKTLTTPIVNGVKMAYAAKSAAYTMTAADYMVDVSGAAASVTITLPAAAGITGTVYVIKRSDATWNTVIDGNAAETIDGAATITLSAQYQSRTIVSDGTNWKVIASV